jgi:hypothetical protein
MGFGPLAHWPSPANLAGSNPTGQDLGRSNRPRPALATLLSSISLATPVRRRRRLASPASSGDLHHRHLGRNIRPSTLYQLHRVELPGASSPRRSGWSFPPGICCLLALRWGALPLELAEMLSMLMRLSFTSFHRCTTVKSSLGHAWSAARALPRHAGQVCTWASSELLLLLSTFSFSYWPWSLTILVEISKPSSQIPLCDAATWCELVMWFDSVSGVMLD